MLIHSCGAAYGLYQLSRFDAKRNVPVVELHVRHDRAFYAAAAPVLAPDFAPAFAPVPVAPVFAPLFPPVGAPVYGYGDGYYADDGYAYPSGYYADPPRSDAVLYGQPADTVYYGDSSL